MHKILLLSLFLIFSGCSVKRTLAITSDPPQANVYIDGEYMGETPTDIPFDFYGTREITLIKKGYHIVNKLEKIKAPLYQTFPIDFFVEFLYPIPLEDKHLFFYTLKPYTPISDKNKDKLLDRAKNLKDFK